MSLLLPVKTEGGAVMNVRYLTHTCANARTLERLVSSQQSKCCKMRQCL